MTLNSRLEGNKEAEEKVPVERFAFRAYGLRLSFQSRGFRVQGSGVWIEGFVTGLGSGISGLVFGAWGPGSRVSGFGLRVEGSRFWVWGTGFGV